ncbi:MAG: Uma2 family endonuclease [Pirellulales bacterium]|nr:Uma2 family endonuclease [Pirellulales bacterium]
MRAVLNQLPDHVIDDRRRKGIDLWDEMWEGVLHMNPPPSGEHQNIEFALHEWLAVHWARPLGNKVRHQAAISIAANWTESFRTPDLVLLTSDEFRFDKNTHLDGPPLAIVEIHSPGDESYEKLPFYRNVGIGEVWVIHRDTKTVDIFQLRDGQYVETVEGTDGYKVSDRVGVRMKPANGKLAIQLAQDPDSYAELPSD